MNYNEMKGKVFAYATRPEGYNGSTVEVGFAIDNGKLYVVAPCGYFWSGIELSREYQYYNAIMRIKNNRLYSCFRLNNLFFNKLYREQ